MNVFKTQIRKLFSLPIREGRYFAKLKQISFARKDKDGLRIVLHYQMQNVNTGAWVTHHETMLCDSNLLRCRDFALFLEGNNIEYDEITDLVGAVFEVVVLNDWVCGRMVPTLSYRDVIIPPPKQ